MMTLNFATLPLLLLFHFVPCVHTAAVLSNDAIAATFSASRLTGLSSSAAQDSTFQVAVAGDDFELSLLMAGKARVLSSVKAAGPPTLLPGANETHVAFRWDFSDVGLAVEAHYSLVSKACMFVEKQLLIVPPGGLASGTHAVTFNVTGVSTFVATSLTSSGAPPTSSVTASSHYGLGDYAVFHRFAAHGAFLTTQNPYLTVDTGGSGNGPATLSYAPMMLGQSDGSFPLDAGIVGLNTLTGELLPTPVVSYDRHEGEGQPEGTKHAAGQLDVGEQKAMVDCLREYLVVPPSPNSTVKINVAWTENDFQLDIADAGNRTIYKRIIDRCADFGITHILFAPRNSDVSDRQNNTDAWGWEQILWFGMGQRLRLGMWAPGDPLPASLTEMLQYMKSKNVKPVAYVYPILAFLAGTVGCPPGAGRCKDGTNPPWIVNGSYYLKDHASDIMPEAARPALWLGGELGNGPMRASLAAPSLQEWLPDTMVKFAAQTGAGGFGFDYTYFEQNIDGTAGPNPSTAASQYSQWAGWRTILQRLHTAKGGKACGGGQYGAGASSCVVDNRQQNHAWGPWMWAQGGEQAIFSPPAVTFLHALT